MIDPATGLKRLTDACTVMIRGEGVTGGSGFFTARGVVISCAHVVARQGVAAGKVTVEWKGEELTGEVYAVPSQRGSADMWSFPDLCVVRLSDPPEDQQWVKLGDFRSAGNPEMYLSGFNNVYGQLTPHLQGKSARLDEPIELDGGIVWQLTGCEMAPGMSGGPVLDLRSGVVCAVAKTRRRADADMGGLVVPASVIQAVFPEVWKENQEASQEAGRWNTLRDALREISDPLSMKLTPRELRGLRDATRQLDLRRPDLNGLWRDIAGDLASKPKRPFDTVIDLAAELSDLTDPGLDPVIRLFEDLASRFHTNEVNAFHSYAAALAERNDQADALEEYRVKAAKKSSIPAGRSEPAVVIRLERSGPNPETEFLLTMWRYPARDAPPRQVACAPGPHSERDIEQIVTEVLAREIPDLPPGRPMIEFALPDHLLDRAVEQWPLQGWPLGVDYPVVVRFGDRSGLDEHAWRSRCTQFRTQRLPLHDSARWADIWIDCQDPRDVSQLNGALQRNDRLPVVALTAWHHGKPVPLAVAAARHAGAAVILWQHSPCIDHHPYASANLAVRCRGSRFKETLTRYLSATGLAELPEAIRRLRADGASREDDCEYTGNGVAILWDDPDHSPWTLAPPSRAPA